MFPALQRFFEAAGCRTQVELAEFLGIRQSSISDAKKRKRIPAEWLVTLLRKKGVNPDWILAGQGSRHLQPTAHEDAQKPQLIYTKEVRLPKNCSMEELITEVIRRVIKT